MTGWGGQLAYLDPDASFLVDHELEPVRHVDTLTYSPDQYWATPRLAHAVELSREVASDLRAARTRAAPQRARVLHDYAGPRVVAALREAVPELSLWLVSCARGSATRRGRSDTRSERAARA